MPTPNTPRGAKSARKPVPLASTATFIPDHLAAIPSPLSAGQRFDWAPVEAQRILAQRSAANAAKIGDPMAAALASSEAWKAYAAALRAADVARYGDDKPDAFRKDWIAFVYNRARLGSWTAALDGGEGRRQWAQAIGRIFLQRALRKMGAGAIDVDDLPDLPRRCDLTDVANDVAERLEKGIKSWRTMRVELAEAAEDCAREALDEMGWEGADD